MQLTHWSIKRTILGLALLGSTVVGAAAVPAAHAGVTPSITAAYNWSLSVLVVTGTYFSAGDPVYITVWSNRTIRGALLYLVARGYTVAQSNLFCSLLRGMCYGQFVYTTAPVPCSSWSAPQTLTVDAYDESTGQLASTTVVPYCQY
jgi:hypothetical protein